MKIDISQKRPSIDRTHETTHSPPRAFDSFDPRSCLRVVHGLLDVRSYIHKMSLSIALSFRHAVGVGKTTSQKPIVRGRCVTPVVASDRYADS